MTDYPLCASLDCYDCVQKTRAILKGTCALSPIPGVTINTASPQERIVTKGPKIESEGNDPNSRVLRSCEACGKPLRLLASARKRYCSDACKQLSYRGRRG